MMNPRYCVDANIFITAWNEIYPPKVFPALWEKLANCHENIILIDPIYDEIDPMPADNSKKPLTIQEKYEKYPLRMWLLGNHFTSTPIDDSVEALSLQLEAKYKTNNAPKGANQNDIKLIAYARNKNISVATLEAIQNIQDIIELNRYKIPAICEKEGVDCINFIELLKRLNIVI